MNSVLSYTSSVVRNQAVFDLNRTFFEETVISGRSLSFNDCNSAN